MDGVTTRYEHRNYATKSGYTRACRRWAKRLCYGYEWAGGWVLCLRGAK